MGMVGAIGVRMGTYAVWCTWMDMDEYGECGGLYAVWCAWMGTVGAIVCSVFCCCGCGDGWWVRSVFVVVAAVWCTWMDGYGGCSVVYGFVCGVVYMDGYG